MKVKDLVAALSTFSGELVVEVESGGWDSSLEPVGSVTSVERYAPCRCIRGDRPCLTATGRVSKSDRGHYHSEYSVEIR